MALRFLLLSFFCAGVAAAEESWTAWGGPNQNFTRVDVTGLASEWPEEGPPVLWSRELGSGYSAITVEDGVLYTQYRGVNMADEHDVFDQEHVVALDAATGDELWRQARDEPTTWFTPLVVEAGPPLASFMVRQLS